MSRKNWRLISLLTAGVSLATCGLLAAPAPRRGPGGKRVRLYGKTRVARGDEPVAKLALELRALTLQFAARGGDADAPLFSAAELRDQFGITGTERNPTLDVVIQLAPGAKPPELPGTTVRFRRGEALYAAVPVLRLEAVARDEAVRSIAPIPPARAPRPPEPPGRPQFGSRQRVRGADDPTDFDPAGLTGKGVIVAVADSGIDWRHDDFRRENGTSRILALYDPFDASWKDSEGKTGSPGPTFGESAPRGTVYTNEQLNAALRGEGAINSRDALGHGTACAGIAAGSGRATANGVPAGTYAGLAPGADLLVAKVWSDDNSRSLPSHLAVQWLLEKAKSLGRPCVVNLSLGGHHSAHDGSAPDERVLDAMLAPERPGTAICVAAGNEGREAFHAGGRFGPRRAGQVDVFGGPADLTVSDKDGAWLNACYATEDEWGLSIEGRDTFLVDENGKTMEARFSCRGGKLEQELFGEPGAKAARPPNFDAWANRAVEWREEEPGRLLVKLPTGRYRLWGFGASEKVTQGRFDFYLPKPESGSFGHGIEVRHMVSSPGNATGVLTVGSYDFRGAWENMDGKQTFYNVLLGGISAYSNPGYRRDGEIKPDVAAPGRYAISSLARDCSMGKDSRGQPDAAQITRDGFHLAWAGTSAATPYAVGVIALMLEKNPSLDGARIKRILASTAARDRLTGAVPNPHWGHGKIDPAAALRETPVGK